jgi:hypothetical protein
MTRILAFSGRKQSGKSTSGEYVQDLIKKYDLGIRYKLYSFADPLKQDICMNLLGLSYEQCYGSDDDKNTLTSIRWKDLPKDIFEQHLEEVAKNEYMTARQVMEVVGTGIFRKLKNNVWVDATMIKIQKEAMDLAIILDNRFPNEVNSVLDAGGFVVRLARDPFSAQTEAEKALDQNSYDWSKFSLVIQNHNLTLSERNQQIFNFLQDKGILPL